MVKMWKSKSLLPIDFAHKNFPPAAISPFFYCKKNCIYAVNCLYIYKVFCIYIQI